MDVSAKSFPQNNNPYWVSTQKLDTQQNTFCAESLSSLSYFTSSFQQKGYISGAFSCLLVILNKIIQNVKNCYVSM